MPAGALRPWDLCTQIWWRSNGMCTEADIGVSHEHEVTFLIRDIMHKLRALVSRLFTDFRALKLLPILFHFKIINMHLLTLYILFVSVASLSFATSDCSQVEQVKLTFYGWPDNSPPGPGI